MSDHTNSLHPITSTNATDSSRGSFAPITAGSTGSSAGVPPSSATGASSSNAPAGDDSPSFPLKAGTKSTKSTDNLEKLRLWYCAEKKLSAETQFVKLLLLIETGFKNIFDKLPQATGIRGDVRKESHAIVIALSRKMCEPHNPSGLNQHWDPWLMNPDFREKISLFIEATKIKSDGSEMKPLNESDVS
jgi:hypothetical protein